MDKKLKKQVTFCIAFYFVFFSALMIIGTFYDLEIDKALFHYENRFALFMEDWGMQPMYFTPLLAWTMLISAYHPTDEAFDIAASVFPFFKYLKNNKITHFIGFLLLQIMYAYFIYKAFKESNDVLNRIMYPLFDANLQDMLINAGSAKAVAVAAWFLLRIALVAVFVLIFRKIDPKYKRALEFTAIVGLLLFYNGDVIDNIKEHFHRIRFREMIAYSHGLVNNDGWTSRGNANLPREWIETTDFSAFGRWYTVGNDMGVYSEPTSFPSGHTSAAAFTMLLAPLFSKCRALNKYFIPAFFVGFLYTFIMGITRLIKGAHYLTDIASGAIIIFAMILLFVGVLNIFDKISQKHSSSV